MLVIIVVAQRIEQMVEFADHLPRRVLDRGERRLGRLGVLVDDGARGPCLHAHGRDVVGHDVVKLAGDPHPIQRDGLG